jgi:hypothetical protein
VESNRGEWGVLGRKEAHTPPHNLPSNRRSCLCMTWSTHERYVLVVETAMASRITSRSPQALGASVGGARLPIPGPVLRQAILPLPAARVVIK